MMPSLRISPTLAAGVMIAILLQFAVLPCCAGEALVVGGTGAALGAVDAVGSAHAASPGGQAVRVLPSLGSSGGIRALSEKVIDIAVIARHLTSTEAQGGMREGACLRTPYALVTSHPQPPSLTAADIHRLYREPTPTWPDGMKVKLVLRPDTETANHLLTVMAPGIDPVLAIARQRADVPKAVTDQDNADFAEGTAGSLAAMGMAQLKSERRALRPVALDGIAPSAAALASGAYKVGLDLCLIVGAAPSPTTTAFIAFLRSASGNLVLRDNEAFVLDTP